MSESFVQLFEKSPAYKQMRNGDIVKGIVVDINQEKKLVTVNVGLKSEGIIPTEQFFNSNGELEVNIGDEVEVSIESIEDGNGETRLSREKAKRAEAWRNLERSYESGQTVIGLIVGRVKGGFTVEVQGVRAFLPGSLVDIRPTRDPAYLEGKELDFKVIKMDDKRNNIVVSRRAVVEEEASVERESLLENLQEGQEVKGIVKNLTDYGAFVDLGGIDGLLHITDMSWKRIKHPSEIVSIGDELTVKILKFDRQRARVSLGLKQLGSDPWSDIKDRYPPNTRLKGRVTNIADYGCFVEIETGIEGLVHMSEMDWTNKNIHPNKVVKVGDVVEVMILEIDSDRRRISLGMKQCASNPWQSFADNHQKGEQIKGNIKSITDFGIFIGLEGDIDGLVHVSDISWNETGEKAIRNYKKGEEIEAIILAIDPERERISLGIKQLQGDPLNDYLEAHPKGSLVTGKITAVDAKGANVELATHVTGYIKAADIFHDKVSNAAEHLKEGEEVEAKIISIDNKNKVLNLSMKDKNVSEYVGDTEKFTKQETVKTTLGDLIKEKMEEGAKEK